MLMNNGHNIVWSLGSCLIAPWGTYFCFASECMHGYFLKLLDNSREEKIHLREFCGVSKRRD